MDYQVLTKLSFIVSLIQYFLALVTRLESKHIHIFGPLGLFSFFGTLLSGISRGRITLHELIPPNTASLPQAFPYQHIPSNGGASQLPGMNLILKIHRPEKKGAGYIYDLADIQGEVKRESPTIMSARAGVEPLKMLIYKQQLKIQAAPIEHSAFCLGYIVTESHTAPEDDKKLTNSTDDDKKLTESSVVENVSLPTNETEDNIQAEFESSIEGDRATKDKLNVKVPIISSVPAMISRSVVILGDTCNASNLLEVLPCPPDVLVHEATFLESDASQAEATKHSTTIMAAEFIAKLCPKIVFLNHFGKSECVHFIW